MSCPCKLRAKYQGKIRNFKEKKTHLRAFKPI